MTRRVSPPRVAWRDTSRLPSPWRSPPPNDSATAGLGFGLPASSPPIGLAQLDCPWCGARVARKRGARFCSSACRKAAHKRVPARDFAWVPPAYLEAFDAGTAEIERTSRAGWTGLPRLLERRAQRRAELSRWPSQAEADAARLEAIRSAAAARSPEHLARSKAAVERSREALRRWRESR